MAELFLDFETRSRAELKRVGAYRYAEDPSTEALCASYALDDGPLRTWRPNDSGASREWLRMAADPHGPLVVAHNAEFEQLVLKHRFGLDLPASRFRCTAAQAARCGLPRSLDKAGVALGLQHQKDATGGHRLLGKLSKPRKGGDFWERGEASEDFDALEEYNAGDVLTMRDLRRVLPVLSDTEEALWDLTCRMNARGMAVDTEAVAKAKVWADADTARLAARWFELTGVPANSPKAAAALGMSSVAKVHVRHALKRRDLSPRLREALEVRKKLAKTSVRKLVAFQLQTCQDGRYRGGFVYAGAERTLRWSGRGVQPQNFPRGLGELTDIAFDALDLGLLDVLFGDILLTVSDMLKGFLVGVPSYLIGDYGQIEARGLAWLAGQQDLLLAFTAGEDIYCQMASAIYGHEVTKKDYDEQLHIAKRQLGKIAVLGCGYGLGGAKFQAQMDANFDVAISEEKAYEVVNTYRDRYPKIPAFWNRLQRFFEQAVAQRAASIGAPGWPFQAGVRTFGGKRFAFIMLPSGRPIYYFDPVSGEDGVSYFGRNVYAGGRWEQLRATYGGKLTENVVQAVSRDAMAEAMLRLDRAGFPIVGTVHDEIVVEAPADGLREFNDLMSRRPEWAQELPLVVESFASRRYRK
jgi:DNA polymerase